MKQDVRFYLEDLRSKFNKITPEDYYLSYSGGKDSHFLLWFIKEYIKENRIAIVGINTYMEHTEILKRIIKNSDVVLKPTMKPAEIKEKYGIPCFSKTQDTIIDRYQRGSRAKSTVDRLKNEGSYKDSKFSINKKARTLTLSGDLHRVSPSCCEFMKKEPARNYEKETGKRPILGVRSTESTQRASKYTSCFTRTGIFTPIHDLTDSLLEEIYQEYEIEIPEIYRHVNRTGCMGCPYGSWKGETSKEIALLPKHQREFVIDYFKESYAVLNIDVNEQMDLFGLLPREVEDEASR